MNLNDFQNVEFGLSISIDGEDSYVRIPVDNTVKNSLIEMRDEFYRQYDNDEEEPDNFLPSEKYEGTERLKANLNEDYLITIRELYNNNNIPVSNVDLSETAESISYYFAFFYTNNGNKELAIKRPSQFKGLLKKKNKLIRWADDTLKVIQDDVFKLDQDFDFIVESDQRINILHPSGFIFISDMEEQILQAAAETTRQLDQRVQCVNFASMTDYISKSKRAAKLIASINSRNDLEHTSLEKLRNLCNSLRIEIQEENGQIMPCENHILDFLYVLDRRQYDIDITDLQPEIYVAASRKQVR
jgi:hypothetical protein